MEETIAKTGYENFLQSLKLILYFQGLEKVLNLDKLVLEVLKSLKFC